MNPFEVMKSKRYKKRLESKMFMNMFRYIQGVNKVEKFYKNFIIILIFRTSKRLR